MISSQELCQLARSRGLVNAIKAPQRDRVREIHLGWFRAQAPMAPAPAYLSVSWR